MRSLLVALLLLAAAPLGAAETKLAT